MRAAVMHGPGDVRIEEVDDPRIEVPTDAVLTVTRASICGSDLWPYRNVGFGDDARRPGHEAIGVVDSVGDDVETLRPGDFVLMPFGYADGTCEFCREGLHTSCVDVGFFGATTPGAQAEAVRIPLADSTLFVIPGGADEEMYGSLLTLTDVMGTGHHAAVTARVTRGSTVAVVGDGAVGLCGVIAADRLGAERIIVMGRHADRTDLAVEFGATDVVAARGDEAVEEVLDLTGGSGVHAALECVGSEEATSTAIRICRPGGAVGRVGLPHYRAIPDSATAFNRNLTIGGGGAPTRAYMADLLPDVLEGGIEPGRVFDRVVDLDGVPDGYRAMDTREAIKVMVRP